MSGQCCSGKTPLGWRASPPLTFVLVTNGSSLSHPPPGTAYHPRASPPLTLFSPYWEGFHICILVKLQYRELSNACLSTSSRIYSYNKHIFFKNWDNFPRWPLVLLSLILHQAPPTFTESNMPRETSSSSWMQTCHIMWALCYSVVCIYMYILM